MSNKNNGGKDLKMATKAREEIKNKIDAMIKNKKLSTRVSNSKNDEGGK